MKAKLFLCCESCSVDVRRNSLSLFHVIEEINSPSFPTIIPRLTLALFLDREASESNRVVGQVEIKSNELRIAGGPLVAVFHDKLTCRAVLEFQGFMIPAPGRLVASFR